MNCRSPNRVTGWVGLALAAAVTGATAGATAPPPPPATQPAAPPAAVPPPPLPANAFALDPSKLPTTPGGHTVKTEVRLNGKTVPFRFWIYLPAGYGRGDASESWPVVMFLHNRGQIGGDGNGSITMEGLPYLLTHDQPDGRMQGQRPPNPVDLQHAAPFICVAPQCPTAHLFDDAGMLAILPDLLETVVGHCHGDPERTYLTGFSYGASNTWLVGADLADHFAAIAPIDGRATPDPDATVRKLARVGVYQVIGGVDNEFKPEAKRMIAALAAASHPDFAFHTIPEGNHFAYGAIYTDPAFWTWMFARRRTPPPPALSPSSSHATVAAAVVLPPSVPPLPRGVQVEVDPNTLPRQPGYAVIRPTVRVDGQPLKMPVGIWLPPGFPRPTAGALPVILSLHNRYAIGQDGSNSALLGEGLPMVTTRGNPNHGEHGDVPAHPVDTATDVKFIGVFPQCPADQKWEAGSMPDVLDQVLAGVLAGYGRAIADPDRVYGTGWSYGGSCTWAVAAAHPERFAAVAVNDGRAMPDPAAAVAKLKDVGVFLAVGDHDGEFIDEEHRMLDALCAGRHPNFVQRVVHNADHAAYQAVYADPAFWGWLLAQRRHGHG